MADDARFFRFPADDAGDFEGPTPAAVEAVGLLIRWNEHGTPAQRDRTWIWILGNILPETFSSRLLSWVTTRASTRDGLSLTNQESGSMPGHADVVKRRKEIKSQLQLIVNNPALAQEAFPNEEQRRNVLPLLERVEQLAAKAEEELGESD